MARFTFYLFVKAFIRGVTYILSKFRISVSCQYSMYTKNGKGIALRNEDDVIMGLKMN